MTTNPARPPARDQRRAVLLLVTIAQTAALGCSHWTPTTLDDVRERLAHARATPIDVRVTTTEGAEVHEPRAPVYDLRVAAVGRRYLRGVARGDDFGVQLTSDEIERIDLWVEDNTGAHVAAVLLAMGVAAGVAVVLVGVALGNSLGPVGFSF